MIDLPHNIWNSPVIRNRLLAEAGFECRYGKPHKDHYFFIVPDVDATSAGIYLRNYTPGMMDIDPHHMQIMFARQVQTELQRHIHHDGLWVAGWTHPPSSHDAIRTDGDNCWGRMVMIWLDQDADPQFTFESDLPFVQMVMAGPDNYIQLGERAYQSFADTYSIKAMKRDMDLRDDQISKPALEALN